MLRINALGRLVVLRDTSPVPGSAAQPRRLALLAVIARAGERGITRSKIIDLLWPDSDEEHGRGVLSKALSALRRDLGAEDVFLGTNHDVRLNPAVVTTDLDEFDAAVARGRLDAAAALYVGPFLDGFRVAGAADFERWAGAERASIERQYVSALVDLATAATARGAHVEATGWWGKLASYQPLDSRHSLGLMEAHVAAGHPRAALQHARMYELLVAQSLDVPADHDVTALAARIRAGMGQATEAAGASALGGGSVGADAVTRRALAAPASRPSLERRWIVIGGVIIAAGVAAAVWRPTGARASEPAVALGRIVDQRAGVTDDLGAPIVEALTNDLARDGIVRLVSVDRARTVLGHLGSGADLEGAMIAAARRAGAHELIDGAVYATNDGRLRLDLRRTDLTTGTLRAMRSVLAVDPLALADSAATHLIASLGLAIEPGRTRSFAATRHHDHGLRAYYHGDRERAVASFDAALVEDSSFAMAAYYGAIASPAGSVEPRTGRFRRAVSLAERAPDRERLTILAHWAHEAESAALPALADTIVGRYPHEPDGHLFAGLALIAAGRAPDARVSLERAIALDDGSRARCVACDALEALVTVYVRTDSTAAAERVARAWVRLSPESLVAQSRLEKVMGRRAAVNQRDEGIPPSPRPSHPSQR